MLTPVGMLSLELMWSSATRLQNKSV